MGFGLNVKKTKSMFFNVDVSLLSTVAGEEVKQSLTESEDQDFKYLGSCSKRDRDINNRSALTWKALNQMDKILKSILLDALKLRFFRDTFEAILLDLPHVLYQNQRRKDWMVAIRAC